MESVDLVVSFDTTTSMHRVMDAVRRSIGDIIGGLFAANPRLRVGFIAHGDYGDAYEAIVSPLTADAGQLAAFLNSAPETCGLDNAECYELVLHHANRRVRWRRGSRRLLVLVGDAVPHEAGSSRNKYKLDWRHEAQQLAAKGVRVYGVDCGGVGTGFYRFAEELTAVCNAGQTVPFVSCRQLAEFLAQLAGGRVDNGQLMRRYSGYHRDSQLAAGAWTTPAAVSAVSVPKRPSGCQLQRRSGRLFLAALGQLSGEALSKTARSAAAGAKRLALCLVVLLLLFTTLLGS